MNKTNEQSILKLGIILFIITAISGCLLGFVHEITEGPIAAQNEKRNAIALKKVLPDADNFEELKDIDYTKYKSITNVYCSTNNVGYAFKVNPNGYGGKIELIVGINSDNKISGIEILKHSETPGLGARAQDSEFKDRFTDKSSQSTLTVSKENNEGQNLQAISGATITSRGVVEGVNTVINFYNDNLLNKEGK